MAINYLSLGSERERMKLCPERGEVGEEPGGVVEAQALVRSMRRFAPLRQPMHLSRSDLHLHRPPAWQQDGLMERAVAVQFGRMHVVLASAGPGAPETEHDAVRRVASRRVLATQHDAQGEHVVDGHAADARLGWGRVGLGWGRVG